MDELLILYSILANHFTRLYQAEESAGWPPAEYLARLSLNIKSNINGQCAVLDMLLSAHAVTVPESVPAW